MTPRSPRQREREAQRELDAAMQRLRVVENASGWFDGWRSDKADVNGKLFEESLAKLDAVVRARDAFYAASSAYKRAILRAERARREKQEK